jgi:hypothetical protein
VLLSVALLSLTAAPAHAKDLVVWVNITLHKSPVDAAGDNITGKVVQPLPPAVQAKLPKTFSFSIGTYSLSITLNKDGTILGKFAPDLLTKDLTFMFPVEIPNE